MWFISAIIHVNVGLFTCMGCADHLKFESAVQYFAERYSSLFLLDWSSVNDNGSDIKVSSITAMQWCCSFLLFPLLGLGLGWW